MYLAANDYIIMIFIQQGIRPAENPFYFRYAKRRRELLRTSHVKFILLHNLCFRDTTRYSLSYNVNKIYHSYRVTCYSTVYSFEKELWILLDWMEFTTEAPVTHSQYVHSMMIYAEFHH